MAQNLLRVGIDAPEYTADITATGAAFSKTATVPTADSQGQSPTKGGRWLRAWLFGDSGGKIQQPDRLQKSG